MPTVSVGRDRLFAALGRTYSERSRPSTPLFAPSSRFRPSHAIRLVRMLLVPFCRFRVPKSSHFCLFPSFGEMAAQEEFEDLCFSFGIELDDVVSGSLSVVSWGGKFWVFLGIVWTEGFFLRLCLCCSRRRRGRSSEKRSTWRRRLMKTKKSSTRSKSLLTGDCKKLIRPLIIYVVYFELFRSCSAGCG